MWMVLELGATLKLLLELPGLIVCSSLLPVACTFHLGNALAHSNWPLAAGSLYSHRQALGTLKGYSMQAAMERGASAYKPTPLLSS